MSRLITVNIEPFRHILIGRLVQDAIRFFLMSRRGREKLREVLGERYSVLWVVSWSDFRKMKIPEVEEYKRLAKHAKTVPDLVIALYDAEKGKVRYAVAEVKYGKSTLRRNQFEFLLRIAMNGVPALRIRVLTEIKIPSIWEAKITII